MFGQKSSSESAQVPREFMTTLHELPGHRIVECFGLVATVDAASGRGAENKGRDALRGALDDLGKLAAEKGANAIVGLQVATFGASMGGVTGDAVGTSLVGTAVIVALDPPG